MIGIGSKCMFEEKGTKGRKKKIFDVYFLCKKKEKRKKNLCSVFGCVC